MKTRSQPARQNHGANRKPKWDQDYPLVVWLMIIVGCCGFAGYLFGYRFISTHTLYHDNLLLFNLFHDNLQSVNQFGQVAWWFPGSQLGWPAYYYSILGVLPLTSPMLSLILGVTWVLGRLGIHFQSYLPIYMIYLSFLQPLTLTLGAFAFVRQFCRNRQCLLAVVILTAFSPGVVLNNTDPGLMEPTAYFLFFCAALLRFVKLQTRNSYLLLCASCMANALLLGFNFILWNVLAIPLYLVLLLLFPACHLGRLKSALRAVPVTYHAMAVVLIVICAAPALVTYSQTGNLVRTKLGSGTTYNVDQLKPGNPIDFLAVSLPGFGMNWQDQDTLWTLGPAQAATQYGFNYMGIPTLAFGFFGLMCGRMSVRRRLLYVIIAFGCVVCMSGSSPFMATLLSIPSPLRSNDHYSDVLFRVGGFLFFIFGAVNALQALIYGGRSTRTLFAAWYGGLLLIMLCVFVGMVGIKSAGNQAFGFFALAGLTYLVLFIALSRATTRRTVNALVGAVLLVMFVDVSTVSYLYLRIYWPKASSPDETPALGDVGLKNLRPNYYTETLISYQSLLDLLRAGISPGAFPGMKAFSAAHAIGSLEDERQLLGPPGSFDQYNSLGVQAADPADPALSRFLTAGTPATSVSLEVTDFSRTYNQLHVKLNTSDECLLFIRDAYSPYWNARVNGQPRPVYRALSNFKCVVVPRGASTLDLDFSPPLVRWLLPLAIIVFWGTMLCLGGRAVGAALWKLRTGPVS
jgi:hypothetical protein